MNFGMYAYDCKNSEGRDYRTAGERGYNCCGLVLGTYCFCEPASKEFEEKYKEKVEAMSRVYEKLTKGIIIEPEEMLKVESLWGLYVKEYGIENVAVKSFEYMSDLVNGKLRMINELNEVKQDEYGVAFIINPMGFHFMLRVDNKWISKDIIDDIFVYDSDSITENLELEGMLTGSTIQYLAIKKDQFKVKFDSSDFISFSELQSRRLMLQLGPCCNLNNMF